MFMVENPFWVFELFLPLFFLSYQTSPLVTIVVLEEQEREQKGVAAFYKNP